jgi:methyltransferase (TIGR00027 family)
MPELRDTAVFEVDHPDSQHEKRARAAALTPVARELHYVPVDFARDDLDAALESAGHDRRLATTWVWEGVVMYLTRDAIRATLGVVTRRSLPESRLLVLYHSPSALLLVVAVALRWLGEPLRSSFRPSAMRALLDAHGFRVERDADLPTLGEEMSPGLGRELGFVNHGRVAVAVRAR